MKLIWVIVGLLTSGSASAFNSTTHEQITRGALNYLRSHSEVLQPETTRWLNGPDQGLLQDILTRSVIDADYQTDLWLTGWFHDPFTGAHSGGNFTFFTSMYHFLNVTVPGDYWEFDGYAYRHGSGRGNDAYLATPSCKVAGSDSVPLGGKQPSATSDAELEMNAIPGANFSQGFKGNTTDWHRLFFNGAATAAVFPPSNVPAQVALEAVMRSPRAASNLTLSWSARVPLVSGMTTTEYWDRHYWRGEVAGLPKDFDRLGMVLHLAQDLAVPQHAQGTADSCHRELEDLIDRLACRIPKNIDPLAYNQGTYSPSEFPDCQHLNDPALTSQILRENAFLDPKSDMKLSERMVHLARLSARWQWGDPSNSVDFLGTVLPDGLEITGNDCASVLSQPGIEKQIRYQYNLGVAVSVAFFELAAQGYEARHKPQGGAVESF